MVTLYNMSMKQVRRILRGNWRLRRITDLSKDAERRLKWFDYYHANDRNARLTCRHFDISPQTFYRWKNRYDAEHLETLEDKSHRPKRVRQPAYSIELVRSVVKLREKYPRWGKDKLVILLEKDGIHTNASTVGRILSREKKAGRLIEPTPNYVSARKRLRNRPYAIRKPK